MVINENRPDEIASILRKDDLITEPLIRRRAGNEGLSVLKIQRS